MVLARSMLRNIINYGGQDKLDYRRIGKGERS